MINKQKENLPTSGFCFSNQPQIENQRKRKERRVPRPCKKTKEAVEHECDDGKDNWKSWKSEDESRPLKLRSARILKRVLET